MSIRILFIGDIVGKPGRQALDKFLPELRQTHDAVIANGENAAGGTGITAEIVHHLLNLGVDVITGGNHIWANKDVLNIIDSEERLIRPLNYPTGAGVPGRGMALCTLENGLQIGVVNLLGRVFMKPMDCPFRTGRRAVEALREQTPIVVVDIHAEATSEKRALASYLDGLATAVLGTHTHVQTSDETILDGGTAYITDVGMTGPHDSVIGVKTEIILENFLTGMPVRHKLADNKVRLEAISVIADEQTGKALSVERLRKCVN